MPDRQQYCKEHEYDNKSSYLQQRWSSHVELAEATYSESDHRARPFTIPTLARFRRKGQE